MFSKIKICLTWKTVVCGLLCVFTVDIKGQACQCTYWNGDECQSCNVGCYLGSGGSCYECRQNCYSCSQYLYCDASDGCKNGWSGFTCNNACVPTCNTCERFKSVTCISCSLDHYGKLCESECSSNCATNDGVRQCNETNGDCNSGCVDGWTGSKCTEKCDMNCISCDAQDKVICNTCSPRFYGQSCKNECSANCVKTVNIRQWCERDGQCTDGCVVGWTGSTCTTQCAANCTACDGIACTSCKPGYYGPNCNIECSANCGNLSDPSRQCQQDDGSCLDDCMMGYKGDRCDVPCDAGCRSGCDRDTGGCDGQRSGNQGNGVAIGGAVGSAVIVLIVVAVLVFIFIKRRPKNEANPERSVTYENSPIDNVPCNPSVTGNDSARQSTANYTTLTASLGAIPNGEDIYEELDKNDDVDYRDIEDYEVPTTSNYYNM